MAWHGILAHDAIVERFRRTVARGRLASSFLFVGPPGVGKKTFALRLAQALFCETRPEESLDPCETCSACLQVWAETHPDLHVVRKPPDWSVLKLELFIGKDDQRGQAGLLRDFSLKPFLGGRRIAIIDDADHLHKESANCLLKTLEEPPKGSVLILIGTSEQKQLPTIRSRCQVVRFSALPPEVAARLLVEQGIVSDARLAREAAILGKGSLARAAELAEQNVGEFRLKLLDQLVAGRLPSWEFVKQCGAFIDSSGKDAPLRRERIKQMAGFAADFYREVLREECGLDGEGDEPLRRAAQDARRLWRGGADSALFALNRCLEAESQVERNANQAALLECWFDDLATIGRTGRGASHD